MKLKLQHCASQPFKFQVFILKCHHYINSCYYMYMWDFVIISIWLPELWSKTCFVRSQWPLPLTLNCDHQSLISSSLSTKGRLFCSLCNLKKFPQGVVEILWAWEWERRTDGLMDGRMEGWTDVLDGWKDNVKTQCHVNGCQWCQGSIKLLLWLILI